jgi:DNA-binding transcriptional MerR regulator
MTAKAAGLHGKITPVEDHAAKQEYSRADVRRMLGITERQLRAWERQGLIPSSEAFTFSDLIALRTLQKLRENGIPPRRVSRALKSLKEKLTEIQHPLSELKIVSDGRVIAVQNAGERMEAISGQLLFNFDTAELGGIKTLAARPPATAHSRERESEAYFQKGLAIEETGAPVEDAIQAYNKAVELNPNAAGALVNLGTIHYRLRHLKEAEKFYEQAILADPKYALAHFNLGNLQDEMGNLAKAMENYAKALSLNPSYADAHFNLALLSERNGDPLQAVRHWKAYLRLDRTSSWAETARKQLERLRQAAIVRK